MATVRNGKSLEPPYKGRKRRRRRNTRAGKRSPFGRIESARSEATKRLTAAAVGWLAERGYSAHLEIAVMSWGKRRADVLATNLKSNIVLCEVKSCRADFATDKKWPDYLDYCNQMYFVVPEFLWDKYKTTFKKFKKNGVGIMILAGHGYAKVVQPSAVRPMKKSYKLRTMTRLAWRAGQFSRRTSFNLRVPPVTEGMT